MHIQLEGHSAPIPARAGETLLEALLRAGVPVAYACQSGNCGACKCVLVSGVVEELEFSESALSRAERDASVLLACRSRIAGDISIRFSQPRL